MKPNWTAFNEGLGGFADAFAQRQQQEQQLKQALALYAFQQRAEQQAKLQNLIAENQFKQQASRQNMQNTLEMFPQLMQKLNGMNQPQGGQPQNGFGQPQQGQPLQSQYQYMPKPSIDESGNLRIGIDMQESPQSKLAFERAKDLQKPYNDVEAGVISKANLLGPEIEKLIDLIKTKKIYEGLGVPFGASRVSAFGETGPMQAIKRGLTSGPGREAGLQLQKVKVLAFGEAGKALTEPEKAIVFSLLNPAYKTEERWIEDLQYANSMLQEKANLMRRGGQFQNSNRQQNQQGRPLDTNTATQLLQKAGGDKNKARALAKQMGYQF